jgi:hypothetical protein
VLLAGVHRGTAAGDLLVLAGAAAFAVQIVLMERFAPRYDALAFTFVELLAAAVGFVVIAVARGELSWPHGWTVWGALIVTGLFATAFAFLAQTWAQRRLTATRTALAFALEPVGGALRRDARGDALTAAAWAGVRRDLRRHRRGGDRVIVVPARARLRRPVRRDDGRCAAGLRGLDDAGGVALATILPALALALVAAGFGTTSTASGPSCWPGCSRRAARSCCSRSRSPRSVRRSRRSPSAQRRSSQWRSRLFS